MKTFADYIAIKETLAPAGIAYAYRSLPTSDYNAVKAKGLAPNWQFPADEAEHYGVDAKKLYLYLTPNRNAAEKYGSHSTHMVCRFPVPIDAKTVNMGYIITSLPIPANKIEILLDAPWSDSEEYLPIKRTKLDPQGGFMPTKGW